MRKLIAQFMWAVPLIAAASTLLGPRHASSSNTVVPTTGTVTQGFHWNSSCRWDGDQSGFCHGGIDIAGPRQLPGNPIYAMAAGTVTVADYGDFGCEVIIDHGDQGGGVHAFTLYGHTGRGDGDAIGPEEPECFENYAQVTADQQVSAGQLIAYQGNAGRAYGTCCPAGVHLHFSVIRSSSFAYASVVDPTSCIGGSGAVGSSYTALTAVAKCVNSSSPPPCTTAHGDRMQSGECLTPGQSITSSNGCYNFIYQSDGNLVLYRTSDHHALWASNTAGTSAGNAIMQTDGNLVVYDASASAAWASNTNGNSGSYLVVQDDGNVVIYHNGTAIWATNTVQSPCTSPPTPTPDTGVNHNCGVGGQAFYMYEWGGTHPGQCLRLRDGSDGYWTNLSVLGLNDVFARDFAVDGYQGYVCEHENFQGQCWWILQSGFPGGTEIKLTSVLVFKKTGDVQQCEGFVVLYDNENRSGPCRGYGEGRNDSVGDFDNRASSLEVRGPYNAKVCEHPNMGVECRILSSGADQLPGFSDVISSVYVWRQGDPEPQPDTPTRTPTYVTPTNTPVSPSPTSTSIASSPTRTPAPGSTPTNTPNPSGQFNDNFVDALVLSPLPGSISQSTVGATTEVGEPLNPGGCITASALQIGQTVWFRFTAPQSGKFTAYTFGSSFDTVLAAYTGSQISSLSLQACNDDTLGLQSSISFVVNSGTTYYLQVGGYDGWSGDLVLHLALLAGVTPTQTSTPTATIIVPSPTPGGPTLTPTATPTPTPTRARAPTATPTSPLPSATATRTRTPVPAETPTPAGDGDANGDGVTNAIDSALVLQLSAGMISSLGDNADVNRDGRIDAIDAALILQYVAGLLGHLPM